MPQSFSLYQDLSVEENLIFIGGLYGVTGEAYRKKRDNLYEFSNLGPFADRRAGALSGGMKQKLALSCALMHDPELLILDEPTTGVDPLSRRQFWEILLQLKEAGHDHSCLHAVHGRGRAGRSRRVHFRRTTLVNRHAD